MSIYIFLLSITIAIIGPVCAIRYLRPILIEVMSGLCNARGGAEFWIRCAYLLAICGTVLLMSMFGDFGADIDPVQAIRRALIVVFAGVFVTVAFISRNVWNQVREWLKREAPMVHNIEEKGVGSISG